MRNCQYCGRLLNDGQICNCQAAQNPNYYDQDTMPLYEQDTMPLDPSQQVIQQQFNQPNNQQFNQQQFNQQNNQQFNQQQFNRQNNQQFNQQQFNRQNNQQFNQQQFNQQNNQQFNQQQFNQPNNQQFNQQQFNQPNNQQFNQSQSQPRVYVPPKRKSKAGLIIAIIIIAVIILAAAVGGVLYLIFGTSVFKSDIESQNSYSADIAEAVNSAMKDLKNEGGDIGNYFISSDSSKSFNYRSGSDLDYKDLNDRINDYFKKSKKDSWIAVYENGNAYYVASADNWDSETVGTYPIESTSDALKGYNAKTYPEKEKLDDISEDTSETIKKAYIDKKKDSSASVSNNTPKKSDVDPEKLEAQHEYTLKLAKAVNNVMADYRAEGYEIGNYFIDSEYFTCIRYSYNGFDFYLNDMYNRLNEYFPESTECNWFVAYENGSVYYAASATSWSSEAVGTYPLKGTADAPRGYNGTTYDESKNYNFILKDTYHEITGETYSFN